MVGSCPSAPVLGLLALVLLLALALILPASAYMGRAAGSYPPSFKKVTLGVHCYLPRRGKLHRPVLWNHSAPLPPGAQNLAGTRTWLRSSLAVALLACWSLVFSPKVCLEAHSCFGSCIGGTCRVCPYWCRTKTCTCGTVSDLGLGIGYSVSCWL